MRQMRLYITTSYVILFFVLFALLFIVSFISLSFNSLDNFPSTIGLKFINTAEKLNNDTRLFFIFMVVGLLFLLTFVAAYLMYALSKTKDNFISAMKKCSYSDTDLQYRMAVTYYHDINNIIILFNQMISTLDENTNNMKKQIEHKSENLLALHKEIDNKAHELTKIKKEAESANKAKLEFIANISHELRTPLNAIMGYSEILKEDAEKAGNNSYCTSFTKIIAATESLLILINQALDLRAIKSHETI